MRTKTILVMLMALLANTVMGGAIAYAVGIPEIAGVVGMNVVGLALSFVPMPSGVRAGVYVEVWTGELVKHFSHAETATWMDGIPDYSRYQNNSVIHLVDVGADPDVLINNSTYPIPIQELEDGDIAISLDKFQTKPTPVTDDELHALSYDKISSVKERHGNAIAETKFDKAIHAFAPAENAASTPVVFTSGDASDGRSMITRKDIIKLKKAFDDAKVPVKGRRLVLCNEHVQDLLLADQKFADQYYNYTSGKISNLYGFEVYEYVNNPLFTQEGKKKSFGATAAAGDFRASVAFHAPTMFKCAGETKMYYSEAKTDPQNQRNLISFRHRFIALPKKQKAIGAIVSKSV
ncbi:hypothetical protein [Limibacterium fermenti]|uniref:phage major capsid protein n=1 Tax=Limibacterium fermenti TaxID=3229863 RepID=UPI003A5F9C28